MHEAALKVYEKVFLVIFLTLLVYYAFFDITTTPFPGDNWDYHIPIARSILDQTFLHPANFLDKWYYPGSSEAILSVLMFLHIPLNLFNFFCIIILFFLLRKLGIAYGLNRQLATIYSVTVCTIPAISFRILASQSIDLWLSVYIVLTILLLKFPRKKLSYYIFLGISIGMLVGTKYSGPLYLLAILAIFYKNLVRYISFSKILVVFTFITILGLFWYIRNFIYTGNPFAPELGFLFNSKLVGVLQFQTWKTILYVPNGIGMLMDALVSEVKIWTLALPIAPFLLYYSFKKNDKALKQILLLGVFGIFVFLISPSWYEYDPIVSSFRYSYPTFIMLILSMFLFASSIKKTNYLIILAFANILLFPPLQYHPKLVFIIIPIAVLLEFMTKTNLSSKMLKRDN